MITALLDTGSGASFIKPALARRLKLKFYNISTLPSFYQNLTVCGALNGPCNSLTNYVLANITIGQSPALANQHHFQRIKILCFVSDVKPLLVDSSASYRSSISGGEPRQWQSRRLSAAMRARKFMTQMIT